MRLRLRQFPASVTFSPDSKTLVTTEYDGGRVQFWDVATGKLVRELPSGTASRVVYRPNGKQFITGHAYVAMHLWDANAEKKRKLLDRAGHGVVVSPDGQHVLATLYTEPAPKEQWGSAIVLLELETGKEVRRFRGFNHVPQVYLTLAYSADGKHVAAGCWSGLAGGEAKVIVWDAVTGKELCQFGETYNVLQLAFAPDSRFLAVGGHERVRLVEPATGKSIREFGKGAKGGVALDPTGKLLLTGGDKAVWDVATGKLKRLLAGDDLLYPGREAAWSRDGKYIAITYQQPPFLGLWEADTGKRILFDESHLEPVDGVAWSPNGGLIATASSTQRKVCLWDAREGKVARSFSCNTDYFLNLDSFHFSPDGAILTVAGSQWDVATGVMKWSGKEKPDRETLFRLLRSSLSPDGALQARILSPAITVDVWDAVADKRLHLVAVPDKKPFFVNHAAFSPDSKTLATAFSDHSGVESKVIADSIVLWDARSGVRRHSFRPKRDTMRRLLFTPDGVHLLVSTHAGVLEIWQVSTGLLRHEMPIPWDSSVDLTAFAVAPHGQLVAVQTKDEKILLWETATGKLVHTLSGSYTRATGLTFGHDGRTLISGHADGSAIVWDLQASAHRFAWEDDEQVWQELAAEPADAYRVLWSLAARPNPTVELLRKRLKPAPLEDESALKQWIVDLGDPAFRKRDNASLQLLKLGVVAAPALRQALKGPPALEVSRRIEKILSVVDTPSPAADVLRDLRAVQLLEIIGGPDARDLLVDLGRGGSLHPKTRAALAAHARLEKR
ncbi:MAG: WD40 repeat domain-containing protein [Gemmataceae bacterium]|nr:WD40 repeat domain-containing protein [Gemmataceae bacterium]